MARGVGGRFSSWFSDLLGCVHAVSAWCLSAVVLSFVHGGVWVLYIGIGMPLDWVLFRSGYGGGYVAPTTVCQYGICVQGLHVSAMPKSVPD